MHLKIQNTLAAVVIAALLPIAAEAQTPQPPKDSAAASAPAPPSALESFMGFYQGSAPGRGILITLEDGTLYGEPTGGNKAPLVLKSGTTYFIGQANSPTTVTFTLGPDGQPTDLVLRAPNGNERKFPKFRDEKKN